MMKELIGKLIKSTAPQFYNEMIARKEGRYSYAFSKDKYPNCFLNNDFSPSDAESKITETIFCFWTGDNEMSDNRKRGIASLQEKAEIPVVLVTQENLDQFILENHPIHSSYELLTLNHRSDYLRCYFMHHYGGGYADIKTYHYSWKKAFEKLKKNTQKFVLGYPEIGGIATVGGSLYEDMKFHIPLLIGNGAFICRSNTRYTTEWYHEVTRRMDEYSDLLIQFKEGKIAEYPVPYTYLMGQIFHPLALKHHKNLLQDKNLMPEFINYR